MIGDFQQYPPRQPRTEILFWLRMAAQVLFAALIVVSSLYLILCYATFGFFGFLTSPFFGWVQRFAFFVGHLYFPLLIGALLSLDPGRKKSSRNFALVVLVLYAAAGILLLLFQRKRLIGWTLLYGPGVQSSAADLDSFLASVSCLAPLVCIAVVNIAASRHAADRETIQNRLRLSSFVIAGTAAFLLYAGLAQVRSGFERGAGIAVGMAVSLAAHSALFIVFFLLLQWSSVIAQKFGNPGRTQFFIRGMAAWLVGALLVRKIVFSAFPFNSRLADYYAVAFSLALVVCVAGLVLRFREHFALRRKSARVLPSFLRRVAALALVCFLFYLFAVRLAAIDFGHAIGNLTAVAVWVLLLWFCLSWQNSPRTYTASFLTVLSLVIVGTAISVRLLWHSAATTALAEVSQQYADVDASFAVIQRLLQPALRDEDYADSFDFLRRHAGIRATVPAPEVMLTEKLTPTRMPRPNIFLFVIDALRQDYLAPYNPAVNFTPAIRDFAEESVVFRQAYSPYGGTALAEPAIWSGFQQLHKLYPEPFPRMNKLEEMLNVDGYHCYISYDTILESLIPKTSNVTVLRSGKSNWLEEEFGAVIRELKSDISGRTDSKQPIFAYAQPANMHTLSLTLYYKQLQVTPHPGFNDRYASGVSVVDQQFGEFIAFLKDRHLYENSIVILTSDHGESLGEMGREGHVAYITPEVMRIPLIIHLPDAQKSQLVWDAARPASLHDITPTLYYLLGHRPITNREMVGHALFTRTAGEQMRRQPDHYFLMSSYTPVFGILSQDQKSLFIADAMQERNYYYDLQDDPHALKNRVSVALRNHYEPLIREDLKKIDQFYGLSEQDLGPNQQK